MSQPLTEETPPPASYLQGMVSKLKKKVIFNLSLFAATRKVVVTG
jgi:hypothetical protein